MGVAEMDRSLELGIKNTVAAVWRHKIIFLLTSSTVFAAVIVGVLSIQPVYEGATLLIGGQVNLEQLPDGSRKPVQSSTSLSRIAESEEVVRQAIEKVGVGTLVDTVEVKQASIFARARAALFQVPLTPPRRDVDQIDAVLPQVKAGLKVRGEPNSDIIRIAYRHKDPVVASDFSNAVAQAFVDRQIALYGRPGAAEFFMRQRQRFDDELKAASEELEKFAVSTSTYSAEEQRQLLLKRLSDLSAAQALTRGSISDRVGQRQSLADSLRKLAPVARSPYVSALVDTLSPDRASGSRVGDSRVLDDRSSDPPLLLVKVYQDSMVALFKINSDLAGAQSMQKQQADEIAKLTVELNGLSQNEQQFATLKRAVTQATFNSDLYAKRMVEEQINAESSAAKFSSVKVLQRSTEPLRPVFPNYPILTLAGAFVGGLAGLGAALLRSQSAGRRRRQVLAHT